VRLDHYSHFLPTCSHFRPVHAAPPFDERILLRQYFSKGRSSILRIVPLHHNRRYAPMSLTDKQAAKRIGIGD
jgi:hypothetical protein